MTLLVCALVTGREALGDFSDPCFDRGNRIGATGLRASERKSASERVSERVSQRGGFSVIFERF